MSARAAALALLGFLALAAPAGACVLYVGDSLGADFG